MPILLLRSDSSTPLSSLVENAQKKIYPLLEYDLQLMESRLDLILVGRSDRKINSCSTDEGFESDIDSLSLVSSDNDSFTIDKVVTTSSKTIETDSANGSSSSDSDTEASESKTKETNKDNIRIEKKIKQSFNLVDCVCYTDVKCTDILIFVIRKETFVFKFDDVNILQKFFTNFTALKALTNQKLINKNFETKFNLLHRTDPNGITHIEITKEAELVKFPTVTDHGPSSIISISNLNSESDRITKNRDINSRQRTESQFIGISHKSNLESKSKISKSNSVENILGGDSLDLINKDNNISKVWNSAENLLDPPKRPERRKKNRAPPPPILSPEQNVLSGEYVRVKVNADAIRDLDNNRLVIKSNSNELHPKKLPNFTMFGTKSSISSFLKKDKHVLRYEPKKLDIYNLNRDTYGQVNNPWMNSVPRMLKKPKSRNPTPMAYRYIDTTQDYVVTHNKDHNSNIFQKYSPAAFGHNAAFSNYLRRDYVNPNKIASLNHKQTDLHLTNSKEGSLKSGSCIFTDGSGSLKDNNLKSVIKGNKDENIKKKNDKKVTFSAYTTVQVV